ncbi:MAG: hypothetical protein ACKOAX_07595, partial [Candidatus Kapaibacterium sp.]
MHRPVHLITTLAVLCLLAASTAVAQRSTRGTEFLVSFLPNFHESGSTSDSLYLSIVASVPTKGTL